MIVQNYTLNPGEKIIIQEPKVCHGVFGIYSDTLTITNHAVILEKFGLFGNYKGIIRYPYNQIENTVIGRTSDNKEVLRISINEKNEDFYFDSNDTRKINMMLMAINDQLAEDSDDYDFNLNYYENIINLENEVKREVDKYLKQKYKAKTNDTVQAGKSFVSEVANNIIKSKSFSKKGIKKEIKKTATKRVTNTLVGGIMDDVLDSIGVYDLQDAFTEMGNDFREEFGFERKMTHEERRRLKVKEENLKEKEKRIILGERKHLEKMMYEEQLRLAKEQIRKNKTQESVENNLPKYSIHEQFEALSKLKELLDMGILTQEEFEAKKKEIINN